MTTTSNKTKKSTNLAHCTYLGHYLVKCFCGYPDGTRWQIYFGGQFVAGSYRTINEARAKVRGIIAAHPELLPKYNGRAFWSYDRQQYILQVSKTDAKKFYYSGRVVYLLASKMRFNNFWGGPAACQIQDKTDIQAFEKLCNSFKYYNCTNETGKNIRFFISY